MTQHLLSMVPLLTPTVWLASQPAAMATTSTQRRAIMANSSTAWGRRTPTPYLAIAARASAAKSPFG
jgi:hypothetical protein